ncbi:DUF2489 domain-containing protein [Pseudacidovorax sp. RU35E]|uniref:DUF2489 domain-containing protein n=1 Tax=Pseudacidovorax sp. RU35E TaxID=1907403 RepID=UPI0009712F82|nr:DUF2489 domain-containing protein [Pseudacidovorax sp. RU35E]
MSSRSPQKTAVCKEIVEIAQAMLDGNETYFEGSRAILNLSNSHPNLSISDEDIKIFYLICSETDHLPSRDQFHLWSEDAIAKLSEDYALTEKWASEFAPAACKSLIKRLSAS